MWSILRSTEFWYDKDGKIMNHIRRIFIVFVCFVLFFISMPSRTVSAIAGEGAEAFPPTIGKPADYKIHFEISKIVKVHDYIALLFSPGFEYEQPPKNIIIPPPWPGPCWSCQGIPIVKIYEDGSIFIKFNSHIELDPSKEGYRHITVTIPKDAGFSNPKLPGEYSIQVKTQSEPNWVLAGSVEIINQNPPGVVVLETGKKGQGDWYITKPGIILECIDYATDICYCVNYKGNKLTTGKSHHIEFETGQYIRDIHYFLTKDNKGISDWVTITVCVDTIFPSFTIQIPYTGFVTSEEAFLLKGQIDQQVLEDRGRDKIFLSADSFQMDGKQITFDSTTGDFEWLINLQPGDNYFQLEAIDPAGNTTTKQLVIRREP